MAVTKLTQRIALLCFFISGVSALTFEVLWVRLLSLGLGHTTWAVSMVLAIYMGGLALGSFWGQYKYVRLQQGILGLYAKLELLIGVLGMAATIILMDTASVPRMMFGMFFLLVPTFIMGMTFPLLARFGVPVAALYGWNTIGAVTGTVLTGFFLVPAIGIFQSGGLAFLLNVVCAALAWFLFRHHPETDISNTEVPSVSFPISFQFRDFTLLLVLVFAGVGAFVCEVAWTRAFAMVLGSSTYAFSIMLATFLIGVGIGGLIYGRWIKPLTSNPYVLVAGALFAISFSVLSYLGTFNVLPYLYVRSFAFFMQGAVSGHVLQFALCALVMLFPTLLMGCVFPWLVDFSNEISPSFTPGVCYGITTIGNIAGAVVGGLIFLPALGAEKTLMIGAGCYTLAGLAALVASINIQRKYRLVFSGAAAVFFSLLLLVTPRWDLNVINSGAFLYAPSYYKLAGYKEFLEDVHSNKLVYYRDGISSSVAVFDAPYGERFLRINGKTDASSGMDMSTQLLLGYLPLLLHSSVPKRAMVIGFGSGVTVSALASDAGLQSIDCVELEPAVVQAAPFFGLINNYVLNDPRVKITFTDARRFLARNREKFDLIVSEPSNPWLAGVSNLYTVEAFQLGRDQLAENGVFCQWFHSYSMSRADFRLVMRTFKEVFPNAMLFMSADKDFFLVGSKGPMNFHFPTLLERFQKNPRMKRDLNQLKLGHPFTFLAATYLLEAEAYDAFVGKDVPLHRDDRPTLEFSSPRSLHRSEDGEIWIELMQSRRQLMPKDLTGLNPTKEEWATLHNMAGEAFMRAKNLTMAGMEFDKALTYSKSNPRTWVNIGRVHNAQSRHIQSEEAFRKALRLDPKYALAWFHLGMLYFDQGLFEKAVTSLESGMRFAPGDPMGSLHLARLYLHASQPKKAEMIIKEAMSKPILNSDLSNALLQLQNSIKH